ncbi:hypothetical protein [Streptomyces seoulensis]|uniref:hypothetical protein n=1 Tax=Streptomyces seoulensis TaxID=73044 RepID=UPI0033AA4601
MTQVMTVPRRRVWPRAALALTAAGVLTLTGLPGLHGDLAYAAKGKRCDSLPGVTSTRPGTNNLPWDRGLKVRAPSDRDSYTYDAPRQSFDGLTLPGDAENPTDEQAAQRAKFLAKFDKPYSSYPENSEERVFARYKSYLNNGNPKYKTFADWLDGGYIMPHNNNKRGAAFETKVINDLGLVGEDWLCQEEIAIKDKNGKPIMVSDGRGGQKPLVRKFDAVNYKTGQFLEFKAGPGRDTGQDLANRRFLEDPRFQNGELAKNGRISYVNGQSKDSATTKYLGRMAEQYKGTDGQPRVRAYEHLSTDVPKYKSISYKNVTGTTRPDPNFAANGDNRLGGSASRTIGQSPATPKDMADRIRRLGGSGPARFGVRGPGGVDFSTLDLAYVGKPVKGKGLPYAFSADKVQDETGDKGWGGKAKAQLISDSFFTWLALTPDKFWVNLNPDQPDKIMDKTFGKTDAGRVLLQADLQMKHDYAKDVDYRKDPGKQYAEAMRAANIPCGDTIRLWITPKTAKVRADDGGLYILDTPLKVNVDHIDRETPDPNGNDCKLTEAQRDTANGLLKQYIIPGVEKKVNTSADYADLRRVYSARVAAEYVRQSDAEQAGDYHAVIDSGDIARWPVRSPNRSWTPKQTWDDYMKSFTKGDYSLPCEVGGQQKMCVMGGVDFGKAPKQNITRVEFKAQHPNLEKTTKIATEGQTESADNPALALLGGGGASAGDGGGTTPPPTHSSEPTHRPTTPPTDHGSTPPAQHTPSPVPSTPAGGVTPPATPPSDSSGSGGLAATGTQVLTVAGLAAALLAAGLGLLWAKRRRTGRQ